jgi:hypothetical protein
MLTLNEIKTTQPIEPTEAVKQAERWRDQANPDREKVIAPDYSGVVYLFDKNGPCLCAYRGRAKKPALLVRYKTEERRDEAAAEFLNGTMKRKANSRKAEERALKVGDVLRSMWGYEQTNIDYYLVTRLVGKCSVEIVEIGRQSLSDEYLQGTCIPNPENVIGTPFTKRVNGNYVRISSFQSASKVEPTVIAGAKIYNADRWTAYA